MPMAEVGFVNFVTQMIISSRTNKNLSSDLRSRT